MNKKKLFSIVFIIALFVFWNIIPLSFLNALFKTKSNFIQNSFNGQVYYESGVKQNADKIAILLPELIEKIEKFNRMPFVKNFKIYVCNSQQRFNSFLAQSPDAKIRGAVIRGDVFISPCAFNWRGQDVHEGTILHELSHLHLKQHTGKWHELVNIPIWFKEGLANLICDCAGEGVTREQAVYSFKTGHHFLPEKKGVFFKSKPVFNTQQQYAMFHKQTKMFIAYLIEINEIGFHELLMDILEGESFALSFEKRYGACVTVIWNEFIVQL